MLFVIFSLLALVLTDNSTGLRQCDISTGISEVEQLREIQHCEVINGNLEILNFKEPIIEFTNLKQVKGELRIEKSPDLVRIEAPLLEDIAKGFYMKKLTSLSLISFPNLSSVKALEWRVIPILTNVRFSNQISNIENIVISDTSLTGFSGFQAKSLRNLDINNNRFLEILNSNVESITGKLQIVSNAKNLKVNLPQLSVVHNASINNVKDLNLENLKEITESISIIDNYFGSLHLPHLNKIGGTLSISKNSNLGNVDLKSLEEINGGLMIINNTRVAQLDFFDKLKKIDGGVELKGGFEKVSFKNLKLVKGSVKIKSSNMKFDCSLLVKDQLNLAIRGGKIECSNGGSFTHSDDDENALGILQKQISGSEIAISTWNYCLVLSLLLVGYLSIYL